MPDHHAQFEIFDVKDAHCDSLHAAHVAAKHETLKRGEFPTCSGGTGPMYLLHHDIWTGHVLGG